MNKVYSLKNYPDTKKTNYDPRRYLGANVGKFDLLDGSGTAWFMSGGGYLEEAVNTLSINLTESGRKLYGKVYSVMRTGYIPNLDMSPVFNGNQANYDKNHSDFNGGFWYWVSQHSC